jgi:hypothetical protein
VERWTTPGPGTWSDPSPLPACRLRFEQAPACGSGLATDRRPCSRRLSPSRIAERMEGVAYGTGSYDAAGRPLRAGGSKRRVLLSRMRNRADAIRLRKAGEGVLLPVLQHEADAVGPLAAPVPPREHGKMRHALGLPIDDLRRESAASGVMMIPIPRAGISRRCGGRTGPAPFRELRPEGAGQICVLPDILEHPRPKSDDHVAEENKGRGERSGPTTLRGFPLGCRQSARGGDRSRRAGPAAKRPISLAVER